jgi:hypothetical protein
MKHLLSLMLMVSMAGALPVKAQTALDLNEGVQVSQGAQEGEFVVSWWGKAGRTYFVQQSFDLMTWQYVPVIESGAEAVCGLNVSCSETRQFWKLRYTDAPTGGNAQTADFDGDGLANLDELYYGADPFKADSDDDSLSDYAEVMTHFTNPLLADTDGDTLSDSAEVNLHLTNPTLADTDGDALSDDAEINLHMTDPNDFDGDDDLLPDGWEVAHSLNPKSALGSHGTAGDPDADLLTNLGEYQHSTNPWDADTDDDTLSDYAEVMTHFTNPLLADTDGDTLSDSAEINLHLTSPTSWDTDGDNLSDGAEVLTHGSNPLSQDSDSDGLSDAAEVNTYQTNPNAADSDGDGITDKSEIKQGANANSASSRPAFESVEVGGNGEAGERKTEQVTLTLPEGEKSYLVVVAVQSEEYPGFTGTASEYDDVVDWKITPAGGAVIEGEKHVNELHADWEQSQEEGTSFLGLSPVAIVATEIIKGKASGTTSVQIELGAKNVSDGALPSTVAAMVMPVEFITPAGDPVNMPVDGGTTPTSIPDGANEFTFSDATSGVLTMKLQASISGFAALPSAEQAKFTFEVDQIGNSTFAWDATNPGGKAIVSGSNLTAMATYTNLPANNFDFGLKNARIIYDGKVVGESKFEVFYKGLAKNHPDGDPNQPNWFHYYKLNAGGGAYGYDPNPNARSSSVPCGGDSTITLADYVYSPGGWYITTSLSTGQLKSTGISATKKYYAHFIGVLAHERQHANFEVPAGGINDPDGDGLSTTFETFVSFTDPNDSLSASAGVSLPLIASETDDEVYAGGWIEENGVNNADTSQDWANPGTNHKP